MKKIFLIALSLLTGYSSAQELVRDTRRGEFADGLTGRHIALWHSHGYYYEQKLDRWEWQRARCFQNVEDIGNMPYVVTYLTPMLENAGAVVLNPRERDTQNQSVIVDNDLSSNKSKFSKKGRWQKLSMGYRYRQMLYANENPFRGGTALEAATSNGKTTATAIYEPLITSPGSYAVYVSWVNTPDNVSDAHYSVYHTGGVSNFVVNQKMFGATWHYLGTFDFSTRGAKVVLSNESSQSGVVTTDAIRIGGGMGMVARRPSQVVTDNAKSSSDGRAAQSTVDSDRYSWKTSGYPSWVEGARYYLQAAGIPDSVYSRTTYKNDYNDDYQSRPLWVNYLKKQGVPIDMSLAFHTDAGVTSNDSIIGTLAIYSTRGDRFSDGRSKELSGTLSGMVQDQICQDIRLLHNEKWSERALRNAQYAEASTPDVPTMLLELLSHQNLADMTYSLDPRFRFTVSRAIYKAITRYFNGPDAVIQPLAPNSFSVAKGQGKSVVLSWLPTVDSLEKSAMPTRYRIYTKIDDRGFSPDFIETTATTATVELKNWGERYGFSVRAVNDGGESFPTELLSACLFEKSPKPVLLVNGFTRISGPSWFDRSDMAGFSWWDDQGVADGHDIAFLGFQDNFKRSDPWLDDDNTGWGSSGVQGWGKVSAGNTHDFTHQQGKIYQQLGVSYVSSSRQAFEQATQNDYHFVEVLFGEQRTVKNFRNERDDFAVYTPSMRERLTGLIDSGVGLLLSGAYLGTDMVEARDTLAIEFAKKHLHYTWMANHASTTGHVSATDDARSQINLSGEYKFNTEQSPDIYCVESPDGIEPTTSGVRVMRYKDTNISAATRFGKVVVFGFPLETIRSQADRRSLLQMLIPVLE